ncbi:ElaB/YqjD/DUF883 family membrane-anchored ribosome-binding protein [Rhodobacter aestuarii]|uniref:Membrane-anchored ribosome-binding protein, inhibits growth in stationary phase, ElaB/YqjD/DUF883 family n=1 Tax=Rhodobacter aestuarii TaxID=453582 RepID=A0A1N7NDE3_9RHOB|nr:DUF883 family protein [Rhodobacter aestuarii]PTV96392.1 ElaB/YqjD/DUF883 family membrane-anchored ribosome-binding protein [Rhodobacter aestuarii]SIS96298.1 Membrane-anchored ribosome-binding protein, inhibits growth in stationary phase, ElaB/YqjD/DUF883 family [Rhodobacter aestuarii]
MASAQPLSKSNGKVPAEVAKLEEQIEKLSAELAELSRSARDYGATRGEKLAEQAQELRAELADRSAKAAEIARERFLDAEGAVEDRVRANPMAALGVAAGVGFLAALLMKR